MFKYHTLQSTAVLSIYLSIHLSICINYTRISQFTRAGKTVEALITQMVQAEPFALSHRPVRILGCLVAQLGVLSKLLSLL